MCNFWKREVSLTYEEFQGKSSEAGKTTYSKYSIAKEHKGFPKRSNWAVSSHICLKCCRWLVVWSNIISISMPAVTLATLLKKTSEQVFSYKFFESIKDSLFIKHFRATGSEWCRLEKSSWLLVNNIIFQPFELSHFEREHFFTKEQSKSLEFSEIFAVLSICFSCLIIVGKLVNLLLTFIICMIFFPCSFSCHFGRGSSNSWSSQFWCPQEFLDYISVSFKYLMKNFVDQKYFLIEILLCSLSLICIDLRIPVVIHVS